MDLVFRGANLLLTLGVIVFVLRMHGTMSATNRTIETLAAALMMMAIPMVLTLVMLVYQQKWEGVFFLSTITNVFALALVAGYAYGRRYHKDAFETAMGFGLASLIIFGGPIAAYFLP